GLRARRARSRKTPSTGFAARRIDGERVPSLRLATVALIDREHVRRTPFAAICNVVSFRRASLRCRASHRVIPRPLCRRPSLRIGDCGPALSGAPATPGGSWVKKVTQEITTACTRGAPCAYCVSRYAQYAHHIPRRP